MSIVIPNYNGRNLLEKNLPYVLSAAKQYSSETEVIVVDDASADGSAEYVERNFPKIKLIKHERNMGFARACDRGVRSAEGNIVILLNTDVRVREDFILPLIGHFADDDIFSVMSLSFGSGGNVLREIAKVPVFKRGYIKFVNSRDPLLREASTCQNDSPIYSFYAVGGHCAIDKSKYLALDGFDDFFYPFYLEDVDLCYRAWKRGWKTVFEPRSVVYHFANGPIRIEYEEAYRKKIIRRNRFLFVWKNITSPNYLYFRHLIPTILRALSGIFVLDIGFYSAFFSALALLPQVRDRRYHEKNCVRVLSDEEIFEMTNSMLKRTK